VKHVLLDTPTAAKALGLTPDGLRTTARRHGVEPRRVGRELRWTPAQLLALQAARRAADEARRHARVAGYLTP
jgi:hypothetical protein